MQTELLEMKQHAQLRLYTMLINAAFEQDALRWDQSGSLKSAATVVTVPLGKDYEVLASFHVGKNDQGTPRLMLAAVGQATPKMAAAFKDHGHKLDPFACAQLSDCYLLDWFEYVGNRSLQAFDFRMSANAISGQLTNLLGDLEPVDPVGWSWQA
ncbi:hypothetical protein [uncultured Roseibium sp.]|uniref:hypothetical protein n=1 Tax=uncultured Roseibium sp. TaxID=1936171 RepID=UPI0032180043